MIHLPPLPGFEGCPGIDAIIKSALDDLKILEENGIDGALIENEYDRPHQVMASPDIIKAMKAVTKAVVDASDKCVIGCEILLNDPKASLDVAKYSGAKFIRTDYFVDRMKRPDYGEFKIAPDVLIAYRKAIGAQDILILADIQVKYATMLEERTLTQSAVLATINHADAIVVSGTATGSAPMIDDLKKAKMGAGVPVIIGSGLDHGNANDLLSKCDGAIVGTALMKDKIVNDDNVRQLKSILAKAS